MQKSAVIPKFIISAVLLIVTLIIMIPTLPVMLNKMSGTIDFTDVQETQLGSNRCIEGTIKKLYGSAESFGDDDSFSRTEYYYLAALGGGEINKEGETVMILFKTSSASTANDMLKTLSDEGAEFSGIVKKNPANADDMFDQICTKQNLPKSSLSISEYMIDLTVSPKATLIRFLISAAFAVACAIAFSIAFSAVKRNNEVDYIHHERAMLRAKQSLREAEQADSEDGIFTSDARNWANNSQSKPNNIDTTQYTGITHENDGNFDDGGFFGS